MQSWRGERSFNPTSTASRLISHSTSSFHHHLCLPHHIPPPTTPNHPATSLSSLLRDVGSTIDTPATSEARTKLQPPLPFPKGCGLVYSDFDGGNWRGRNTRGDPGNGRPAQCVPKMNRDESCGSFSPSILSVPN